MNKKIIEKQAKCEIQVKLLASEVQPLRKEKEALQMEVKHLEYRLFREEMKTYGIGIIGFIILFFIARRAFQVKYKKELEIEIAGKKYEKKSEERVDSTTERSKLSKNNGVLKEKESDVSSRSALSDVRRGRRERAILKKRIAR